MTDVLWKNCMYPASIMYITYLFYIYTKHIKKRKFYKSHGKVRDGKQTQGELHSMNYMIMIKKHTQKSTIIDWISR